MGCWIGVETPPGSEQVACVPQATIVGNWRGCSAKPVTKLSRAVVDIVVYERFYNGQTNFKHLKKMKYKMNIGGAAID